MDIQLEATDQGYRAVDPEFRECWAQGRTPEDAVAAVRLVRADRIREVREQGPRPAVPPNSEFSRPDGLAGATPEERLGLEQERLEGYCDRWRIRRLWLFGSVVGEDFGPMSDVDVLVEFEPGPVWSLFDLGDMAEELESWFGRPVDLVPEPTVTNPIRRQHIEANRRLVYEAD